MFGRDKKLHFAGCAAIAAAVGFFAGPGVGFGAALVIGVAKEIIWDWKLGKGTPDIMDIVADAAGAAAGAGVIFFS